MYKEVSQAYIGFIELVTCAGEMGGTQGTRPIQMKRMALTKHYKNLNHNQKEVPTLLYQVKRRSESQENIARFSTRRSESLLCTKHISYVLELSSRHSAVKGVNTRPYSLPTNMFAVTYPQPIY